MKKHIIATVTNDLYFDQRMHRICTTLSREYVVTLVGRRKHHSPNRAIDLPFQSVWLTCFFQKGKMFYLEYQIRLFFFLFWQKYDAIYTVDLDTTWAGYVVSILKGKKRIFDAHEYFTELPELKGRPFTKWIWMMTGRLWVSRSHLCITVNEPLAQVLQELYGKPFVSIPNYPTKRIAIKEHPAREKKVLLYQGVLNTGRGLEMAIDAMEELPDWKFWLAGEGDLSTELRQRAAHNSRITFLGYISPDELSSVTQSATIGLNLLVGDSLNYYYSSANKFFDYVQAGVPQITMDFPVYRGYMDTYKVGELLTDLTVTSLVRAIHLLSHPDQYQSIRENCYKASEVWTWERVESDLLSEIRFVLGNQ
jgi:glycosyltransferase involved in cell wall biosynthesis